jgi:hypothetical protein
MDQINLTSLITPAIAISIIAYLTHFFGKIIEDQNPFADNRKWAIEISGIFFMVNIVSGIVGIYVAINGFWFIPSYFGVGQSWLHLVTVFTLSFFVCVLLVNNMYLGSKLFNINKKTIENLEKNTFGITKELSNIGKYVGIGTLPIVLFYFATLEYLSGNIYWIIIYFSNIFLTFILLALNFSLKKFTKGDNITLASIYFIGKKKPLTNVRILKVNEDNVRIRVEDKIIILNKTEVSKIEMVIPEKDL